MTQEQLRTTNWILKHLSRNADLFNTDQVDEYIKDKAGATGNYKRRLTQVYAKFLHFCRIPYERPRINVDAKLPRIPTGEQLKMLIANTGKVLSIKLQLSLETGLRPIELQRLKAKDFDVDNRIIYPSTAKHGSARALKIPPSLTTRIQNHILERNIQPENRIFLGTATRYGKEYRQARNNLADKLKQQQLKTIRLYDFRHYFATMLYAKTKDLLYVKQQLGHKRIDTTLIYTQLLNREEADKYTCKTATTLEQATQLIENGFEYVTELDDVKLFRKRK